MNPHSRITALALAGVVHLGSVPSGAQSRTPLALPAELSLREPLTWKRILDQPVAALLVEGDHVWARSQRPEVDGGGRAQGNVYEYDGHALVGTDFYDSYQATTSNSQFVRGIGPKVVLAGIAGDREHAVLFESKNGPWQQVSQPFPEVPFLDGSIEIAQGPEPTVCLFGEGEGGGSRCMHWVGGKGAPIPPPVAGQRVLLDGRGSLTLAFSNAELLAWRGGWKPVGKPLSSAAPQVSAVKAGTEGRAWLIDGEELLLWDGTQWGRMSTLVSGPADLFEASPKDIWLGGTGGLSHFDGNCWSRVIGIHGSVSHIAEGRAGELWVAAGTGLWHGTPRTGDVSVSALRLTSAHVANLPKARIVSIPRGDLRLVRTQRKSGTSWMAEALALERRDGELWAYDGRTIHHTYRDRQGRRQVGSWSAPFMMPTPGCIACMSALGEGLVDIASGQLRVASATRIEQRSTPVAYPSALASDPAGRVWVVGNGADLGLPLLARGKAGRWEAFTNWPAMAPLGIASFGEGNVWVVGASDFERLAATRDFVGDLPPEASAKRPEGVLDHLAGTALVRYRSESPLFSVAQHPQEDLLVAVGADGLLVEVRGEQVGVSRLPGAPWLFAVVSDGESLWVLGEQGTLLRRFNRAWTSVSVPGFVRPAFTSVAREGDHWLVGGPDALYELTGAAARPQR
jgi:hypothetical protein